jgi:hypothetical protein
MLESIRKEVFERLGKERAKLMKQSRELKLHGFEDLADKALWEVYGLDTAVEALGFTVVEVSPILSRKSKQIQRRSRTIISNGCGIKGRINEKGFDVSAPSPRM